MGLIAVWAAGGDCRGLFRGCNDFDLFELFELFELVHGHDYYAGPRLHPSPLYHLCGFLSLLVSGFVFAPAQLKFTSLCA